MFIRTISVAALFLAFSCVPLQAGIDTSLNVPSNATGDTVLMIAQSDADDCDAADDCYDNCEDNDDNDDCYDACDDKYPNCEDDCDPDEDEDCD
jgi:hypothetical protein